MSSSEHLVGHILICLWLDSTKIFWPGTSLGWELHKRGTVQFATLSTLASARNSNPIWHSSLPCFQNIVAASHSILLTKHMIKPEWFLQLFFHHPWFFNNEVTLNQFLLTRQLQPVMCFNFHLHHFEQTLGKASYMFNKRTEILPLYEKKIQVLF